MEPLNTSTSSGSRNFSYPNHQKPQASKLRWIRTVSLPNMNRQTSAYSPQPAPLKNPKRRTAPSKPAKADISRTKDTKSALPRAKSRTERASTASPDRYWSEKAIGLRKVSDSIISSIRSFSGSVRSLSRRLITPPSDQDHDHVSPAHQSSQSPSNNPPSSPYPILNDPPPIPPRISSNPNPTSQIPVLVEYTTSHILPIQRRHTSTHSVGIVYLCTSPPDTLETFSLRVRNMPAAGGGEHGLFSIHPVVDNAVLGLWVCWNQGPRYDDVESRVVCDEEFRRVVELMAVRGVEG